MKALNLFFYFFILSVILPVCAYAYLDPATGSYIIQIVIASVLTSLFVIKHFWKRIKDKVMLIFSKNKNKQES